MKPVNIVVTCTSKKTQPVPEELSLGSVRGKNIDERLQLWIDQLQTASFGTLPANHLYRGGLWNVSKELGTVAIQAGYTPNLWILSAGYGLLPWNAQVKPYGATFTASNKDSVHQKNWTWIRPAETHRRWMKGLSKFRHSSHLGPVRSFTELTSAFSDVPLVIAAGKSYLEAILEDLKQAASFLVDPDKLIIVCTGASAQTLGPIKKSLMPSDRRLIRAKGVGGGVIQLNASLTRRVLELSKDLGELTASSIRPFFFDMLQETA